jgi:DNA-binding protein YbaB
MAAVEQVLRNLEHNARRFREEASRLDAANRAGAATVSNDVVTVTVDGSGALLSAEFAGDVTEPERWRQGFASAYVEALAERRPAHAQERVTGLVIGPEPQGPLAPEQDEARHRIEATLQRARTLDVPLSDAVRTATIDGVTIGVNGMRLIVDASVTRAALDGGTDLDSAVLAAYHLALAELDAMADTLLGGIR